MIAFSKFMFINEEIGLCGVLKLAHFNWVLVMKSKSIIRKGKNQFNAICNKYFSLNKYYKINEGNINKKIINKNYVLIIDNYQHRSSLSTYHCYLSLLTALNAFYYLITWILSLNYKWALLFDIFYLL